jgi:hypothetical protein
MKGTDRSLMLGDIVGKALEPWQKGIRISAAFISCTNPAVIGELKPYLAIARQCPKRSGSVLGCRSARIPTIGSTKRLAPVFGVLESHFPARLDVSIPSTFSGQRGCEPASWKWRPSLERQKDLNPPEQRAAQRALPVCRLPVKNGGVQSPYAANSAAWSNRLIVVA